MAWDDEIIGPDVASAGLHVSERIGKEVAARLDLEEALEASRYASHPYSSLPKEWPSLVEVAETRELPPTLIERYNESGGEGTALCGIFSGIRRAWASVDNSLFLWRFDKWDGQCQEYNGEEQAICAVGLARTKPGIFVEAIQYLLVLATPVELILIGVCCTASGDGTDPYAEISLQPLPDYTVPSDGFTMTCIACTNNGHIFLAGRDGHIYEIEYTIGSGWHKRCRKVCLTGGLGSLLSRWVLPNALKFGAVDPAVDMVVDDERHIIYARTEGNKLQVYDLGVNGNGPLTKIAEEKNLTDPRETQYGVEGPQAQDQLHENVPSTFPGGRTDSSQRPTCLKVVSMRPSPPLGVGGGLTFGAISIANRAQPEDLVLKVESAFYSVEPSSSRALRELVSSLPIEGRMLCAADILPLPDVAIIVHSLYADAGSPSGFNRIL
uniref:Nucleoporin Nup133/Nup155-like N-terminal domain-containing protein n=1 Tax=Ananas comosus var. bracteatus TaxID=296719 RepID=A0A6V7NVT1_ANACO|nr:unnamed protein product [Ananas comosus var. bracteatus]